MSAVALDAAGRPTIAGHPARLARWPPAIQQGPALPGRPTNHRRDRRRHRHAGNGLHAARLRALIVVLWRAGLRIHEALALGEADPGSRRGSLLVRRGKGGRRREVGMDD